MSTAELRPQMGHILFMDAVGYSTLPSDEQATIFRQLQDLVSECPTVASAAIDGNVVRTPTGDGMALAFFDDCASPLRCAIELVDRMQNNRSFELRMGIHSGEVVRQPDINGNPNVSGDGINIAQRVMDFGDSGHILMSLEYASRLQQAGDPAANDCYDIGVATAKHGKRVHLFNYHRPAAGAVDIPVRIRKDDHWVRPKELHLGTTGRNIVLATLQIVWWLLVAPSKWRTHVTQIDPRLEPNFSVIDLTGPQVRRNRDLRQLLIQGYVVCPLLTLAITSVVFWAMGSAVPPNVALFSLALIVTMGCVVGVMLGIGVGFIAFLILGFQAWVQVPLASIFGLTSWQHLLALGAVCAWATVALSAVLPAKRRCPAWRELLSAAVAAIAAWAALQAVYHFTEGLPLVYRAAGIGALTFLMTTAVLGLRLQRWSRGFVFGQIAGVAAAAASLAGPNERTLARDVPVLAVLSGGVADGLLDAALWAAAFAVADKLAGLRAAIVSGLVVTCLYNFSGWPLVVPLAILATTYGFIRRRETARPQAS